MHHFLWKDGYHSTTDQSLLNGEGLSLTWVMRYSGLLLDEDITWQSHIQKIVTSIQAKVWLLTTGICCETVHITQSHIHNGYHRPNARALEGNEL